MTEETFGLLTSSGIGVVAGDVKLTRFTVVFIFFFRILLATSVKTEAFNLNTKS
jgi:hypothetical protein